MNAYKKYITIEDPERVVLTDLPFQAGQTVEVIILAEDNGREAIGQKLRYLLKKTQAIPGLQNITQEDIEAEIEDYRQGE